jgi:uncharacterized protein YcgI (DUF1989 family)
VTTPFTEAVAAMWPAFKATGMLCTATDADGAFDVSYKRPSEMMLNGGAISNEHEIEYQTADRPSLAEGDTLSIVDPDGTALGNFRVRRAPYVDGAGNAADGTFSCAILTKV